MVSECHRPSYFESIPQWNAETMTPVSCVNVSSSRQLSWRVCTSLKASQCWWWESASSPTWCTSACCRRSRTYCWVPRTSSSLVVNMWDTWPQLRSCVELSCVVAVTCTWIYLTFSDVLSFPFDFSLSVGGGEPLYGLPVLCTRVLSILRGKPISLPLFYIIYTPIHVFIIFPFCSWLASRCWHTSPSACGWSPSPSSCHCRRGKMCSRPPCSKEVRHFLSSILSSTGVLGAVKHSLVLILKTRVSLEPLGSFLITNERYQSV